ncbi:MAG: hypothetical protein JO354_03150 [Verrucomicrobia bacterium]|nr:hypothetical protein [Verrucomicrobiota bacterium]
MTKSKDALRERLALLPFAEKLRLLDALRGRALAIGHARTKPRAVTQEEPGSYAGQMRDE